MYLVSKGASYCDISRKKRCDFICSIGTIITIFLTEFFTSKLLPSRKLPQNLPAIPCGALSSRSKTHP